MDHEFAKTLVSAALDRELEPDMQAAVQAHIETCATCQAESALERAASCLVRERATRFVAPVGLRRALTRQFEEQAGRQVSHTPIHAQWLRVWASWGGFASGAVVAASLTLMISWGSLFGLGHGGGPDLMDDAVSAHARALLTGESIAVASSDQHTVKPWFNGKLDFAPPVTDFAPEGFALLGGRLDYLEHRAAAALVYHHGPHPITVFILPVTTESRPRTQGSRNDVETERGYHILHFQHDGMDFRVVSDVEAAQLVALKALLENPPER